MGLVTEMRILIRDTVRDALREERQTAAAMPTEPKTTGGQPEILTVAQVAKALQVNEKTVRTWIQRGKLPAFEAGGWRIKRADLDALMVRRPATGDDRTRIEGDALEIVRLSRQRRLRKGVG